MLNLYHLKNKKTDGQPINNQKMAEPANGNKLSAKFESYTDPEGNLSGQKLKLGIWLATRKLLLYKIVKIFLLLFDILIWGFGLYAWGRYLWQIPDQQKFNRQIIKSINYNNLNVNYTAMPLQILGSQIFKSGVDKYDVIADVTNPNDRFIVYFDYYFNFSDQKLVKKQSAFLLPKQNRPIAQLGVESATGLTAPGVIIENVRWKRVSAHEVVDTVSWQNYRLDFALSNFSFTSAYAGDKTKPDAHIINFQLVNNSPYGYIDPAFLLSLYSNGSFVGVLPFKISGNFDSMRSTTLDLRSFADGLAVDNAVVYPMINIYDKSVYFQTMKK